jgi:Mn-dependent DtxR family transcriptional regulator
MGQGEVIELLKQNKKWLTTKEIAEKLGVGTSCTVVKLRKMRAKNQIKFKRKGNGYLYSY